MDPVPFSNSCAWRVRATVLLGVSLLLCLACDDAVQPVRDLEFCSFIHPGTLDAETPGQVRAGAYVGPDGCWHLGGASLVQEGRRLVLSGYAIRDAEPGLCTTALVYTSLTLDIPPLESGTYAIVAGDLVDTLVVGSPAPRPAGTFFAARGEVFDAGGGCTIFGGIHCLRGGEEVSGVLVPFLVPPHFPPLPWNVLLAGTVVGADSCLGMEFHSVVVRSLRLEELPQPRITGASDSP